MIESRILKGFRDSLPDTELPRQKLISVITSVFRSFGYVPIDTPALEYTDILLGKGGGETDKQIFRFTDNGGRDVALRFDLTVPLARFVSANYSSLTFPFKRYHIAKVWRGEKPQKGRYREFLQCDFDIIGTDNVLSDFETLLVIYSCFVKLGIGTFRIHISHRKLISEFLQSINLESVSDAVLRIIDKLGKTDTDSISSMLTDAGLSPAQKEKLLSFISLPKENYSETLAALVRQFGEDNPAIVCLKKIEELAEACSILDRLVIDTSITRGLDYYTGLVWETFLEDIPGIGSVASGGRYDNLTALYSDRKLPGVGSSIGLDRLIAALEETGSPLISGSRASDVLVLCEDNLIWTERTACTLRSNGINADCYSGEKNRGSQFAYAQSNGIRYVICSGDETEYEIKDTSNRQMVRASLLKLKEMLA